MITGRNISFDCPKFLIEQIGQRAAVNDRSRNAEFRYLIDSALTLVGESDIEITLPSTKEMEWKQIVARLEFDQFEVLQWRADRFKRSIGREIVRLSTYTIQETTRRDLALIEAMMSRQGR